jgi:hypothetical protein
VSRLAVLSVHYLYPELLADQVARLALCAGPLRTEQGLALSFHPIVHRFSRDEVAHAVLEAGEADGSRGGLAVRGIDLRDRPLETVPRGGRSHGHSLAEAFRLLRRDGGLAEGDLIAVLDHDAHPLDARLFAALAAELTRPGAPAALGIPHWHGELCYLHPSLLLTRVEAVESMGLAAAFHVRLQQADGGPWADTCEGLTLWCRERQVPVLPLRVCSTAFPWAWWDGGDTERSGWHGEPVRLGHLMRYGLAPGAPLVSHVWAGALGPYRSLRLSAHTWEEVLAAYLAESMGSGS